RYPMLYKPFCDMCCYCTYGKCDLSRGRRGACGIDTASQQGRNILLWSTVGLACHASHARDMIDLSIDKFGWDLPLSQGPGIEVEAPLTRLVCGIKPEKVSDLIDVQEYLERECTELLAAVHTGMEGRPKDFESKAFHAGMLDLVALEICDIAQISAFDFPKADPQAALVELGLGTIDVTKPVILCVGHNVAPGAGVIDYLEEVGLENQVEVSGICCSAHDISRYHSSTKKTRPKVIGPVSHQTKFIRSGVPDVIIADIQCIRTDLVEEAKKIDAVVLSSDSKVAYELPDMTEHPTDEIIKAFIEGKVSGALILDQEKLGEVAVRTAVKIVERRQKKKAIPTETEFRVWVDKCILCGRCRRACPKDLKVDQAIELAQKEGDTHFLAQLWDLCIGCLRCENACPEDIPCASLLQKAAEHRIKTETYWMRSGRGAISDTEIRNVGRPIVFGEIPGVLGFVGCANYPESRQDQAFMVKEFIDRNFIIVAGGCAAMDIAQWKDEEGKTLYEQYPGEFDAACLLNVGSCVSDSHIAGAAVKIANIFAKRPLRGNFEEIADYILNRVGAVGIAWGAYAQKALAIATGCNRLGIPVVVGPHGSKYRRSFLGNKIDDSKWTVWDARTGKEGVYVGPVPEHLAYPAETMEEAIPLIAKLCMRANDTPKGRMIKVAHYWDLHKKYVGTEPIDIHYFIRADSDIPINLADEIKEVLSAVDWKPIQQPDPTLVPRLAKRYVK
ncbi:MAG: CO dehydrogenase/acetyl-CoA synthase complex subunit alpha, partial [Candidatus Heimdallarchaeota archaeon]